MSIGDLPLEAAYSHNADGPTGALAGVQPFGGFSVRSTYPMADGRGCSPLHMLPDLAYQGFGGQR